MPIFQDFLDAFQNPSMRHAMLVHFPVVLSIIGIPFAVLAALLKVDRNALRWATLGLYLAMTLAAYLARESGEDAEEAVEGSLSRAGHEELEEHQHHGHNLWLWPAGVSALLGISFARPKGLRLGSSWLAVAVGVVAAERVARTADHGGRLVYEYGAGTPDDLAAIFVTEDNADPPADPRLVQFRQQVVPILVEHCLRCHNPNRKKRSGGLDQTSIASILEGGHGGPAVVPGNPDASLLITAVRWDDPELKMPAGKDKLGDDQIAALEQWVRDGAVWEEIQVPDTQGAAAEADGHADGEADDD